MATSCTAARSRWLHQVCRAGAFVALIGVCDMASSQQTHAGRDMLEAASRGDVVRLKELIAAGAPLDPADAARQTPLLHAVKNDHVAAAVLLIDVGANINAQAANMDSPWLLAGALGR